MNDNLKDLFARLAEPFAPDDLEWRAGATNADKTKALALAYITSRAVMDRLDEVVGPENWRDEYKSGPDGGVICGLSLRVHDEWVTKWDGAENTEFEAIKGGLSDAFKRAGYKWGIGRYLYKLESVWVPCEVRGKSVVLKSTPPLPPWALPKANPAVIKPENAPASTHIPGEQEKQILEELGFGEKPAAQNSPAYPAPAPPKGNGSNGKRPASWSASIVEAVLKAHLAANPAEAVRLLNESGLAANTTPEQAIAHLKSAQTA